ncbi:MAG: hypothetical protein ACODAG_02870 [Myxococcota bacterium]
MSERVKDLFELPESIHKIGFVEKLNEAVERPKRTAEQYVVTPGLRDAFDRALRMVGSALKNERSQAAYLHGSFGSGKSHFMALLSLMFEANEEVWRVPELHPLRDKHPFVGDKKLLQLRFHMIGHEGELEDAIFRHYVQHVRERHPEAPLPGLFADEKLFEDARTLLDELGDDAFFAPMNEGAAPARPGWGVMGGAKAWDRARFERTAASTDPKEREQLFNALVRTRFRAYADESRQYKEIDEGLAIVARHARELGYDGIVLFLDELILWLSHRASDVAWFHNEVQKMVKLVEAQEAHRAIPIISFIARQRDLSDMVGHQYEGAVNARVRDSLKWSEGRFDTIRLEDNNLPAIVEKRVLKPRNEEAKARLDQAFEEARRSLGTSGWNTLLGELNEQAFRQLYPFSPALVDALVALSNSLQRERTAIRLLTEVLVEHIEDLKLGEVVRVGDLWDVLSGGTDSAEGVMRARFESARQVYRKFLPIIQSENGTDTPERCQRERDDHPARLGCSNCPEQACRLDNRLIKTLILAALVPEVAPLKDLTASKLHQLNHGSIKVPIPGTEASVVAGKLRSWASQIGQLHVGSQTDPSVRLQLEGVDLKPILEQAQRVDNEGARQRVLRDLLFDAMNIASVQDWERDHSVDWRSTKRLGRIRFGNVRRMTDEALRCDDDHDWKLIIDYPFDEPGHGPHEDEERCERFREETGSWTLVWLPSFFSKEMNDMLGEVVVLQHILESPSTTREYVRHLSVEDQTRATNDLTNLRTQKESRLRVALEEAYGLVQARGGSLDSGTTVDRHLQVLTPGASVRLEVAPSLGEAIDPLIHSLLEQRYPRHPRFGRKLTKPLVEKLVERFGEIVDSDEKRIPADKGLADEMRATLEQLGLVRVTETAVHLVEDRLLAPLDRKRQQKAAERPEVGEVRSWIDESGAMGLQPDAMDLVVRCYARWAARTLVAGGQPYEPKAGKPIPDHVVLEKPDLPSAAAWQAALGLAGSAFGVALPGRALHGDNLKRFEAELDKRLTDEAEPCARLPALLERWLGVLQAGDDADRLRTARSADTLCAELRGQGGKDQVERLSAFVPETSARALGASIGSAGEVVRVLEDALVLGTFEQLRDRRASLAGAEEILERARSALRQDELNLKLAPRLRELAVQGQELLRGGKPDAQPAPVSQPVVWSGALSGRGRSAVLATLRAKMSEVEAALAEAGDDVELQGEIRVVKKEKP